MSPDPTRPTPELAHEIIGAGAPGDPPLVLLHAFPLDRGMWRPAAEALASTTTSILVDLPGLGATAVPGLEPDLAVSADAVARVLDRLGVDRAVLAGVSMGGYVAMAFAQRHPERLAGLALVDTKASADPDEARANRERMAVAVLGEAGTRALLPMLDTLLGPTSHAQRPAVVAAVRQRLLAAPAAGVAWSQRAMAARPDRFAVLENLQVPAVVVVGDEDGITPTEAAHAMADTLPDAVLTIVPRAGHLCPLERPDEVAHALTSLLLRVPAARPVAPSGGGPGDGTDA